MLFTTLKSRRASFTETSVGKKKNNLEWFYMKLSQGNYHFNFIHSVNIKAFK